MNVLKKQSLQKIVMAICGRKGLALSEDQRREIQQDVIGKASTKEMTAPELDDLISHLRRLQKASTAPAATQPAGKTANEWRFVFRLAEDRQPSARKIFRLAEKIGSMQNPPVPVMSKAYIEGIASQMMGADTVLQFCDAVQLHKIVQVLEMRVKQLGG